MTQNQEGAPERARRPRDIHLEEPDKADWVDNFLQVYVAREVLKHGGQGFYAVIITGPQSARSIMGGYPEKTLYDAALTCLKEDIAMSEMS